MFFCRGWNGGVADLRAITEDEKIDVPVYGCAAPLTPTQLQTIDIFEGVSGGVYRRQQVNCEIFLNGINAS